MSQNLKLFLKSSIFDKGKFLIIEPDYIEFGNTSFSKFEISEMRYGVKPINGYRFRIGRIYCIDIKNLDGQIIKIRLKSLYRVRRILLGNKYKQIVEGLFENYINDISLSYLKQFNNKNDFTILGNSFTQEGLILDQTNDLISWLDLGTKNYYTYYSIFSIANPKKYKTFDYLTDWNTVVLYSVSREILRLKKAM